MKNVLKRISFFQTKEVDLLDKVLSISGQQVIQKNNLDRILQENDFVGKLLKGAIEKQNPTADKKDESDKDDKKILKKEISLFEDQKQDYQYVFDWIETQGYQDYNRFKTFQKEKDDYEKSAQQKEKPFDKKFDWFCSENKSDKLDEQSFNKDFTFLQYKEGKEKNNKDIFLEFFGTDIYDKNYDKNFIKKIIAKYSEDGKIESFKTRQFCFSIIRSIYGEGYQRNPTYHGFKKTKKVLEFIFDGWAQLSRGNDKYITAESIYNFFKLKNKCADKQNQQLLNTKQINSFILQVYDTHEGYVERREFVYSVMMGLMQRHIKDGIVRKNEDIEKEIKERADKLKENDQKKK